MRSTDNKYSVAPEPGSQCVCTGARGPVSGVRCQGAGSTKPRGTEAEMSSQQWFTELARTITAF